jgi:hypothetical protein
MKNTINAAITTCFLGLMSTAALAQSPQHGKDSAIVVSSVGVSLPLKNDAGKTIKANEMFALMKTGNYKIMKATDKNNKPYWLVKSAPGAGRMQSPTIVVRPHD